MKVLHKRLPCPQLRTGFANRAATWLLPHDFGQKLSVRCGVHLEHHGRLISEFSYPVTECVKQRDLRSREPEIG